MSVTKIDVALQWKIRPDVPLTADEYIKAFWMWLDVKPDIERDFRSTGYRGDEAKLSFSDWLDIVTDTPEILK